MQKNLKEAGFTATEVITSHAYTNEEIKNTLDTMIKDKKVTVQKLKDMGFCTNLFGTSWDLTKVRDNKGKCNKI